MVSSNQDMVRKKGKVCMPLGLRLEILRTILNWYNIKGEVFPP